MKDCPRCAEKVQDDAKVCRFCGHEFVHEISPAQEIDIRKVRVLDAAINAHVVKGWIYKP